MRKGDDGEKKKEKKRMLFLVATTSLPAVDRPNADRWNAARSCQNIPIIGSILWCDVVLCGVMWHSVVGCGIFWCDVV